MWLTYEQNCLVPYFLIVMNLMKKNLLNEKIKASFIALLIGYILASWVIFFHNESIPILASLMIYSMISAIFVKKIYQNAFDISLGYVFLVYSLPFIHLFPYIFSNFDDPSTIITCCYDVIPYMFDEQAISTLAMIATNGAIGIYLSFELINKIVQKKVLYKSQIRVLSMPQWIGFGFVSLALSILSQSSETIINAEYGKAEVLAVEIGFRSSWMISYVLLSFLFSDLIIDNNRKRSAIKFYIATALLIYITLFIQIFSGDREIFTLLIALFFLFKFWSKGDSANQKNIFGWETFLVFTLLVVASKLIGFIRFQVVDININNLMGLLDLALDEAIFTPKIIEGTWSAVYLSPLSVVGDYINNLRGLKFGIDYWELFLSLPPQFIAEFFGYTRPWDIMRPAMEITYGLGGTHILVLPFINFGIYAIFPFAFLISSAVCWGVVKSNSNKSVKGLSFLTVLVMIAPHAIWYGEKAGINGIIGWILILYLYKFFVLFTFNNIKK